MDVKEKIKLLEQYKSALLEWDETREARLRSFLNQSTVWVRREVIEAKCYATVTIGPPPITGGFIARDVDPFGSVFEPPYGKSLVSIVVDMVDRTIGVLRSPQPKSEREEPTIQMQVQEGYAFVAMPMDPENPDLVDVLDAIKEGARRCGIHAERVDEPQYNDRITDRMLESIRTAQFVIADLTLSKPNVFWEAGYAHGIGKTPIYVARHGTRLEFDLKDYPVIFFKNMKELKDGIEKRLRGLEEGRKKSRTARR